MHSADSLWSMLHPVAVGQILALLALANGTPVVATKILGERFSFPLDGGLNFLDGRPFFGSGKTVRGIALAVIAAAAGAPLLGVPWATGALAGASAMAGDLLSSFLKRRLGMRPSSRFVGVDQVPESLIPALACRGALGLDAWDIAALTLCFLAGEIVLSRALYRLGLRDRPY